jgi:RNA polymerase sigma factor (sigma-70 family)
MQHPSDAQLLRDYAAHGSDPAFAGIVARHTDLVYSAALRQTGSPDLARDLAQSVFTDLARKAGALARPLDEHASLAGWLYQATRFAVLTARREERRRLAREKMVMEQFDPAPAPDDTWAALAPVLDEAMAELGDTDREAVVLRYFKNLEFSAVAVALGVSEAAAQKRVSRAVERLRECFAKRGVAVGASALVVVISASAVKAAPAGLAVTISTATALAVTATKAITMTTLKKVLIAAALIAAFGAFVFEVIPNSRLHRPVQTLQEQATSQRGELSRQHLLEADKENERLSNMVAQANSSPDQVCRKNLGLIYDAIARYALENRKPDGVAVSLAQILPYLGSNALPQCPSGGTYTLGLTISRVGHGPSCSMPGHTPKW